MVFELLAWLHQETSFGSISGSSNWLTSSKISEDGKSTGAQTHRRLDLDTLQKSPRFLDSSLRPLVETAKNRLTVHSGHWSVDPLTKSSPRSQLHGWAD
mmetsp:Transcript_45772/g.89439  ORF Transcript_45772/g.89439 Transcript_45772/m.89439 type:complete len:99 (-) Transcript_45772:171-467(-)